MNGTLLGNEVFDIFKTFIESNERNSKRTAMEYENRVREFFQFMFRKDVENVTVIDVKKIKPKDVESFVGSCLSKGNSNSTIQTKVRSVKSFFKELSRNGIRVNVDIFTVKLKNQTKHHDALYNMAEVEKLYEFAKGRANFPDEQYLYIKSLFITANRMESMLKLRWTDIKKKFDYATGEPVWVVEVIDKGNKEISKPITEEFYNELLSLKMDDDLIFKNISESTIRRTMKAFSRMLDDGRDITIHGIKASALTIAYKMCKDINKVKQLGSHSSISTTEIYVREEESYTEQLSYLLGKTIDFEKVNQLSHEELLAIVMNNEEIKFAVALKAQQK